jgi:hypothetical protein
VTAATCPWCQAPRDTGPSCPKCGANYAKAEAIKKQGKAAGSPEPVFEGLRPLSEYAEPEAAVDSALEWKLCLAAIPAALAIAVLLHLATPGLLRIVFAMPLHEMGHAVAAWLCGKAAIPALWLTHIPEERGFVTPILVAGAMGYLAFRAWRAQKWLYAGLCAAVLVLAAIGTFGLKLKAASALITFAKCRGEIDQPIRHPVIANDFATPSTTITRSNRGATFSTDGASPSYAMAR